MTKRCSVLQRLCEQIELDGETLRWYGRWRPPLHFASKSSLAHFHQPEFSYDHSTVMNVNRFLFFQLYDPVQAPSKQQRIQLRYFTDPEINTKLNRIDELNVSLALPSTGECGILDRKVPLKGRLYVKEVPREGRSYRTIPIEFPEYKGEDRIPLVMHYLHGGTDADRPPATVAKRRPRRTSK